MDILYNSLRITYKTIITFYNNVLKLTTIFNKINYL